MTLRGPALDWPSRVCALLARSHCCNPTAGVKSTADDDNERQQLRGDEGKYQEKPETINPFRAYLFEPSNSKQSYAVMWPSQSAFYFGLYARHCNGSTPRISRTLSSYISYRTMAQAATVKIGDNTYTVPTGLFIANKFVPSVDSDERIE